MSFEKKWRFDINRAYGTATSPLTDTEKYVLWYYKAFLTGQIGGMTHGLWTIVGSSDAVTGGMDGVDRWGSVFDSSKIVYGLGTAVHSWVVLSSPLMNRHRYYLLLAYNANATYNLVVQMGADSPPTGGSITANPTVQNSVSWASNGTYHHNTNPGPIHIHGGLASDGSFYVLLSRDNTGKFASGMLVHLLANARPGDLYPVWFYLRGDQGLTTGFGGTSNGLDIASYGIMRAPDGSVGANWAGILPATTNFPTLMDAFEGSAIDWDIWVGTADTTYRSIRGRLQDICFIGGGVNTGSIDSTADGVPNYMVVGNYWFPTNDAPIL